MAMPYQQQYTPQYTAYNPYGTNTNAMNDINRRMQELDAMRGQLQQQMQMAYPQQPPQAPPPQAPAPQGNPLTVRSATNIDEVRATPIDLMSTNVFVNFGKDEIYVSRIDGQGLKEIRTYKVVDENALPMNEEESQQAAQVDLTEVYTRLDRIESLISNSAPAPTPEPKQEAPKTPAKGAAK